MEAVPAAAPPLAPQDTIRGKVFDLALLWVWIGVVLCRPTNALWSLAVCSPAAALAVALADAALLGAYHRLPNRHLPHRPAIALIYDGRSDFLGSTVRRFSGWLSIEQSHALPPWLLEVYNAFRPI